MVMELARVQIVSFARISAVSIGAVEVDVLLVSDGRISVAFC